MTDIRQQLLEIFAGDEPEYERAAALGPAALPVLRELLGDDPDLAARAIYVAGLMGLHESLDIIATAAKSDDADMRTDAAGALRNFAVRSESRGDLETALELLAPLLDDEDATVRRFAQRAAAAFPDSAHDHAGRGASS